MADYWNLDRLTREWTARGLNRRDLMSLLAGGAGTTALLTMMGTRPEGAAAQDGDGTQVSVLWRQPLTFNPLFSTAGNDQQIERLIFGSLVKMSADLEPIPDLAESIDVSEDASVYTFNLHRDITFNDGQPLTAQDVVFTLERAIDARTGSYWRGRLLGIEGAEAYGNQEAESISGITTPDDYTVQITLTQPDSAFLIVLCNFSGLGILPRHILGEVPPDQLEAHPFSLEPTVSAGAYSFVRFESDQYLEVERNPNYFGGAPAVERLFLRILTPEVGQTQLETGELDLMTLSISEAERVREIEGVTVVNVPSPSMDFIVFNLERPYLQNQQMRIAMTHAIDREGIAASVFQGEATVVNSPIFGPEWMGVPEGLDPHPYDPELARQLLAESGFDTSQTLELIHYIGRSPEQNAALVVIQEQLREVGFQIEIVEVDIAELIRRVVQENDFDLFYEGGGVFRADPNISAGYLLTRNFAPDGGNVTHYSNPQVDELYAQGQAAPTLEERKAIYTEVAQILNEEAPWVFLWSPNSLYAVSDRLQGFVAPSYADNKFWNAETWSVTE